MTKDGTIGGVIFDMDGTITQPVLDFARMKREMGLPAGEPILEALARLDDAARREKEEVLHRFEREAAEESVLNPGAADALAALAAMGLRLAIVTRNSRASVAIVLERHGLHFDATVTREDSAPKPDPQGVIIAARRIAIPPAETMMVGDYEFDIAAGRAAGCSTVLLSLDGRAFPTPADYLIRSMSELPPLVAARNRR